VPPARRANGSERRPCPSLRRRAGVSPAGEKLSISGGTPELHLALSKFFQNSATPFHALLALFLLLAAATSAIAQVPSKVTLSRANTPTADGFTVAWSDLSNETAYHLEHTTSANFTTSTLITNISANATSHALTGLTPGTTYYVRVRGAAAGGNGTWSDVQANQLLSIDPGQTRYLSVAGVPHGASHSVNFTISDIFGSANSAGLAAGATASEASTILLLGSDGSTAHTVFYNSSQNQWREGDTNKGSEIVGFGKGFMVRNNTSSADIFLLSGSVPPLDTNSVTVFPAGAPAGRLSLVTPSRTTPTSLRSLGLTHSNNTTTGLKRATTAKDADLLLIPDSAGGLRRYHFDGTNWRSGLRTVGDPTSVTIPAGGGFFLRKASGSSFEQWRPPLDIATNGLLLHLDAGNPDSFPGNGTIWTDLSGNGYTGNLTNGPTFSSANGGSIVFDGINDYILYQDITLSSAFTIILWMKTSSSALVSNWRTLVWLSNNSNSFYIDNNQRYIYLEGASPKFTNSIVGDGVIHHVVLSRNSTNHVSAYVDSKKDSITAVKSGNLTFKGFGTSTGSIEFCNMHLFSAQIYNRALTEAEIFQNYNSTKGRYTNVGDGLVLRLDAGNTASYPGTGTAWTDLSGIGNNGTLVNGPTFSSSNNGTISFDGSNDYANLGNSIDFATFTNGFSICFWVRSQSTSQTNRYLFSKTRTDDADNQFSIVYGYVSQTFELYGGASGGANRNIRTNSQILVNDTNWHYLVYTVGSTTKGYLDGVERFSNTYPSLTFTASTRDNLLNSFNASGHYGNFVIGGVSIYNRILSAHEIEQNFNAARGRYGL
jgi:hypothetical protein